MAPELNGSHSGVAILRQNGCLAPFSVLFTYIYFAAFGGKWQLLSLWQFRRVSTYTYVRTAKRRWQEGEKKMDRSSRS